jgi:3-oxoacyl-[acyl-carrier protein] reductase
MKRILIMGASSGIGLTLLNYYEKKGCLVYGISRRGQYKEADFTKDNQMGVLEELHELDMVIYCSGIMPLIESGYETDIWNTNYFSLFHSVEKLVNEKRITIGGNVVFISSTSVDSPDAHQPTYAASKAAGEAYMRAKAKKHAMEEGKDCIRFNIIRPGFFSTNLVPGKLPEDLRMSIPMKYEAVPEQIINAIECCESSTYMTGSIITIDGGCSL